MTAIGFALVSEFTITPVNADFDGAEKMSFDFRVIFEPDEEGSEVGEYTIREVYYDENSEIVWWSDEAVVLASDDFWEMAEEFDMIAEAFEKPVLVLSNDELIEDTSEEETEDDSEEETEE